MCLNVSYSRVQLRNGGWKVIAHPCGHCVECAKKYQNDWMLRLDDEATQWRTIMFATLTYSSDNVPYITLEGDVLDSYRFFYMKRVSYLPYRERSRYKNDKSGFYDYLFPERIKESASLLVPYADIGDIQRFMKRLRITFLRHEGRPLDCKYFICSEYGPATLRPHYHMILFCNEHELIMERYIKQCYDLGNVYDVHKITSMGDRGVLDAMRYVSKYTSKPAEFENPYVVSGSIPKPKRLSSKNLGDSKRQAIKQAACEYRAKNDADGYTEDFIQGYLHLTDIMKDGFRYLCPRYWRDVIFPHVTVENTRIKDGKEIVRKSSIKDINDHLSLAIDEYVQSKLDAVYNAEQEQIRHQHPDFTDTEVIHTHTISLLENLEQRYTKAVQSYYRYYAKSAGQVESSELPVNDGRLVNEEERALISSMNDCCFIDSKTDDMNDFHYKVNDFGDYDSLEERFNNGN